MENQQPSQQPSYQQPLQQPVMQSELPQPPHHEELPPGTLTKHKSGFPAMLVGLAVGSILVGGMMYVTLQAEKARSAALQEQLASRNTITPSLQPLVPPMGTEQEQPGMDTTQVPQGAATTEVGTTATNTNLVTYQDKNIPALKFTYDPGKWEVKAFKADKKVGGGGGAVEAPHYPMGVMANYKAGGSITFLYGGEAAYEAACGFLGGKVKNIGNGWTHYHTPVSFSHAQGTDFWGQNKDYVYYTLSSNIQPLGDCGNHLSNAEYITNNIGSLNSGKKFKANKDPYSFTDLKAAAEGMNFFTSPDHWGVDSKANLIEVSITTNSVETQFVNAADEIVKQIKLD